MKNLNEIRERLNKARLDYERWKIVLENKDVLKLILDNDDTLIVFKDYEYSEDDYWSFDEYIGWADGLFTMLDVVGIEAESV